MLTPNGRYGEVLLSDLLELYLCQIELTAQPYRYTHREKNVIVKEAVENIRTIIDHSKKNFVNGTNTLDDIPF